MVHFFIDNLLLIWFLFNILGLMHDWHFRIVLLVLREVVHWLYSTHLGVSLLVWFFYNLALTLRLEGMELRLPLTWLLNIGVTLSLRHCMLFGLSIHGCFIKVCATNVIKALFYRYLLSNDLSLLPLAWLLSLLNCMALNLTASLNWHIFIINILLFLSGWRRLFEVCEVSWIIMFILVLMISLIVVLSFDVTHWGLTLLRQSRFLNCVVVRVLIILNEASLLMLWNSFWWSILWIVARISVLGGLHWLHCFSKLIELVFSDERSFGLASSIALILLWKDSTLALVETLWWIISIAFVAHIFLL